MSSPENPKTRRTKQPPKTVVIAGAGVVGVSTAYFLARNHGVAVTLVDVTGTIAPGASGKAAGFLALNWNDGTPTEALTHRSFALHQEIADRVGAESIQYRRVTCTSITTGVSKKRKNNADIEWAVPRDPVHVQSMGEEDTLAQVHPKFLCEKLWEEAEKMGCKLVKGKIVGAVHDKQGKLQGALLEDGATIAADALLYACGPWIANVMNGIKVHSLVLQTKQVLKQVVFFYAHSSEDTICEVFVRPNATAFCTGHIDEPAQVQERPGEESVQPEKILQIKESFERCTGHELRDSPVFGNAMTEQACYQPCTEDFLPIMGPLSRRAAGGDGCFIAGGHNCWGILLGPATGECMADLIVTGKARNGVDLSPFRPSRYRNLKPVS